MVRSAEALAVGDGRGDVFLGPIQNAMQYERVKGFLAEILEQNLKVATGGQPFKSSVEAERGYFVTPTIVDNPHDDARIVIEEPFGKSSQVMPLTRNYAEAKAHTGPVFPVMKWDTEDEVIARANNSDMGLGASVWSKDLQKARALAERLKAGSVWINTHLEIQPDAAFGGHKNSGIGSEWGLEGLRSYCNTQTLYLSKK